MKTKITENHALKQAKAQFVSIKEMVENYRLAQESDDDNAQDKARQRIEEDALSVQVRSTWHRPGEEAETGGEFEILLCTGGPACRIIGELDEYNQPESATIQHQDWGTPWTDHRLESSEEDNILLDYCRVFYFGE